MRRQIGSGVAGAVFVQRHHRGKHRLWPARRTFEEIIEAAKAGNAHEFILGKPDGYDTIVGERGSNCRAANGQRVSIARAILHDPKF
jgi:ABC-type multidrug transport system fused ATPase/permease subunit